MPTEADIDNARNDGDAGKTPTIVFDTKDLDQRIADGVVRGLSTIADRNRPPAPVSPEYMRQEISDDDDVDVKVQKGVHNAMIPMRQQLAQFQEYGLNRLADLTDATTSSSLPYRQKYKGEIDAELSKLPATARAEPATLRLVHDTVVARHLDDIRAEGEEAAAKRLAADDSGVPGRRPAGGGSSRSVDSEGHDIPTPEDLGFNSDQLSMIEERGGPDRFAQKISGGRYTNWGDYAKARVAMTGSPSQSGMRVVPFRRLEAKKRVNA